MVERTELKINGMYRVHDSLRHQKCALYSRGKHVMKSQRLTVTATTDLFLATLQCAVLWDQYVESLYTCTCNLSRSIPCPFQQYPFFSYGLLGSDALSAKLHGDTSQDRNLDTDHLEKFDTNTFDVTSTPAISRSNWNASSMVVLISNCLSNDFASTFCCSTAVRTGIHNAFVCLVTLQAEVPAVIFRDICPLC